MWYQLWSVESGNIVDEFDTEDEALDAALVYLTPDSSGATVDVALVISDDRKPLRSVASRELADLVNRRALRRPQRSA